MQTHKTISVVIPSWNSKLQLEQNLPFVFEAAEKVDADIVIVDDNSNLDKSADYLKSLSNKIKFFENSTNLGYSETVNKAVQLASGDLIMLLNTDVRPSRDCFEKAIKYFDDENVYAVGFNSGEAWMGGEWKDGLFHHFRVEPSETNKNKENPSLWASGGQAAFARRKWLELGGMDLLFKPFYWEDTDMGFNAWKRGWQIKWAPDCKCEHDHNKSVIANNFSKKIITNTAQRNQFLFIWKNISDTQFLRSHFLKLPYYLIKYPIPVLNALFYIGAVIKKRNQIKKYWVRQDRDILKLWKR